MQFSLEKLLDDAILVNCTKTALGRRLKHFFSPKCTKSRLAAGLSLDSLGYLECSPKPVAMAEDKVVIKEGKRKGEGWKRQKGRESCAPT